MKKYKIEPVANITVFLFDEFPAVQDILDAIDEAAFIRPNNRRLWIFDRGVDLSLDQFKRIAKHGEKIFPVPSKSAVVITDEIGIGFLSFFEGLRTRHKWVFGTFQEKEEAIAWLNKPLPV